ncbi:MAG: hypothetical protein WD205_09605, partial [Rhodothermales bacterium]
MSAPPSCIHPVSVADLAEARAQGVPDRGSQQVLEAERAYVDAWRTRRGLPPTEQLSPSALCISGGGIRSASFAAGVLQALAAADLLKTFDYLSTVSGGGYIASSLTWLLHDSGRTSVGTASAAACGTACGLGPDDFPYGTENPSARDDAPDRHRDGAAQFRRLSYLKTHGAYLTPGNGIGLASLVAVLLRGAFLSLLAAIPLTATAFAGVILLSTTLTQHPTEGFAFIWKLGLGVMGFLIVSALLYAVGSVLDRPLAETKSKYAFRRRYDTYAGSLLTVAAALGAISFIPNVHVHVGTGALAGGLAAAGLVFVHASRKMSRRFLRTLAQTGSLLILYAVLVLSFHLATWSVDILNTPSGILRWVPVGLLLVSLLCGRLVNINIISMHRYYRDRLMETFLPDDASELDDATGASPRANTARLSSILSASSPTGPYHILNTNLNLVGARSRVRRIRGGDSFILTPLYCGSNETGWRRTDEFLRNGLTLATAMAVSGAAVEPDAGVAGRGPARDPSVAALMTLLNLTLGFWIPHPLKEQRRLAFPNHFNPGFRSFLASAYDGRRTYLELGDGGHFENLGLYEMIRRRVRLVVVSDAGADPEYRFNDLLNAMQRVQADFGTKILFTTGGAPVNLHALFDVDGAHHPSCGHVIGTIAYPDRSTGAIVLVKASMINDV